MDAFAFQGWNFRLDKERTQRYYANTEDRPCACAGCRNFYDNADTINPMVVAFLERFGVRPERPINLDSYSIGEPGETVDYAAYYDVCGYADRIFSTVR